MSFVIGADKRNDGVYRIANCPKLKRIKIGLRSFIDYQSFELTNLPSLQSIDIAEYCFLYAPSFSLTGMSEKRFTFQTFLNFRSLELVPLPFWLAIMLHLKVVDMNG